jgi:hypothetical protein
MPVVIPASRRPSPETSLGNHEDRIRALERVRGGEGGLRWAMFVGFISAAASMAFQYLDMTEIVTNDDSLYALLPGTGANAGLNGPSVSEEGMYRVSYTANFGGTAGDKVTQYFSGDIGIISNWLFGWNETKIPATTPDYQVLGTHTNFSQLRVVGGPLWAGPVTPMPMGEIAYVANLTAARAFTADVQCLIEKLSDDYVTNLVPGGF